MYVGSMRKSFKDSLKVLEADLQHANTLASDFPREYDGACVQMRMSYSPAAQFFLFFVQWSDCHLAGALGLLRILIFQVKLVLYCIIYPSLMQLQSGVTDSEERKQKKVCMERYRKREDEDYNRCSDVDIEREEECGICMEMNGKLVLPKCNHAMCSNCYNDWCTRSLSCPFCRVSLKRVESSELWVYIDHNEAIDVATITRENLRRLFMYIDKLPLVVPDSNFDTYDSHLM
ncbi:Zinc finger, RING/FYVE/PHD-type [Cynara cardunculus var. scolymus]|uniref:Zinc finger, RING/FYVE/PHD-type n=1 Tax=Cynara cardunculus var. scolymus TaxID=59895 RepID=A0A118JYD8_CYNCS|nr:Zinc finger, RING/FYVE/PHD-type [Cynara cardunculus var. scolymus]